METCPLSSELRSGWQQMAKTLISLKPSATESSWSSGRSAGFPVSQYRLGSTWLRSSSAKKDLRFTADARVRMSQWCTCILNKVDGLLGCTRRIMTRRWREGVSHYSCWWVVPLIHAKYPLASIVMAWFVPLVNGGRRKGELGRWCDIVVSRICLATGKTSYGPSAQSRVRQYYS